nr:glycoside hydrolase [Bacteroidales bacterium]
MKKILPLLLVLAVSCNSNQAIRQYDITDFGAVEGKECTAAIQAALDKAGEEGGGQVIVPYGCYLTSTIYLRDNVDLHLEEGARLQGVDSAKAYSAFIPENDLSRYDSGGGTANSNCVNDRQWMKAMFIGQGIEGASISGEGTIDGRHVFNPDGEEGMRGPHTIVVAEATDFRLDGISITCAANYAFLGYALVSPVFDDLDISEGWDGIHIR